MLFISQYISSLFSLLIASEFYHFQSNLTLRGNLLASPLAQDATCGHNVELLLSNWNHFRDHCYPSLIFNRYYRFYCNEENNADSCEPPSSSSLITRRQILGIDPSSVIKNIHYVWTHRLFITFLSCDFHQRTGKAIS